MPKLIVKNLFKKIEIKEYFKIFLEKKSFYVFYICNVVLKLINHCIKYIHTHAIKNMVKIYC